MKVYRVNIICADAKSRAIAESMCAEKPGCYIPLTDSKTWQVAERGEFLRDWHLDGKALLRLLPAWAKCKNPPSIGAKVTAFYAVNSKVVTGIHQSGCIVGSEGYYDWLETQPNPFRGTDEYLGRNRRELRA